MKKFKTNFVLWIVFALALFVPCWFIPWLGKHDTTFAAMSRGLGQGLFAEAVPDLIFFLLLYGLPASAIAWVLQALIVVCLRRKGDHRVA